MTDTRYTEEENVVRLSSSYMDEVQKSTTAKLAASMKKLCTEGELKGENYWLVYEAQERLIQFDKALRQLKVFYEQDKQSYITAEYAAALAYSDNLLEEWK